MLSPTSRLFLGICLALAAAPTLHAEPGEDGNVTISSGTVTLNAYTTLSAAVAASATTFTVTSAAALALPACGGGCSATGEINPTQAGGVGGFGTALAVGDLLMIYQPQELSGTATTTNDPTFGTVTDQGQAGLYEFAYVSSVAGSTITIVADGSGDPCTGLKNAYDAGAMVIRVPQLRNLTITGGSLVAPPWNGSTGGVVALDVRPGVPQSGTLASWVAANGTVQINAANGIDVTGRGFRGGEVEAQSASSGVDMTTYRSSACADGGRKGESILGWAGAGNTGAADCHASPPTGSYGGGNAYGRGALANGGGGGNSHNAAGGGGANGGDSGAWNGAGNPGAGFDAAWFTEDDTDVPNSQPLACVDAGGPPGCDTLRTSSGGGRGGYTYAASNQDALTLGPGVAAWAGNLRRNRGGLGGRPLGRGSDRFYFGGGGGAGDANRPASVSGGNGGGLVFLMAQRVVSSVVAPAVAIRADGAPGGGDAVVAAKDAPGGGGGGGTIVMQVARELIGRYQAAGGVGGSQTSSSGAESEGGGGGGGGGVIAASWLTGSHSLLVPGGSNGTSSSPSVTEFPANGGTVGAAGEVVSAPGAANAVYQCMVGDGGTFTTDAGHAYFNAARNVGAGSLTVDFVSSFELGHAAYYLEGERNGLIERASAMIPRTPGEAERAKAYSVNIADLGWTRLWLVEVDATGQSHRRGPFELNRPYGSRPSSADHYDWTAAQSEHARYLQAAPRGNADAAYLEVAQAGMQRVTHEQLLAAGVDLSGAPAGEIALSDRHGPVMRSVTGGASFGPGSAIEFYGDPQPDLQKSTHTYLVERTDDADLVLPMPFYAQDVSTGGFYTQPSPAQAESRHTPSGHYYDPVSPTDSPWYMYELYAEPGSPANRSMAIAAPGVVGGAGTIHLTLSGFVDLPAAVLPDHHVRVFLNNTQVADERFDGIVSRVLDIPVTNVQANNTVRVELVGDTGQDFDMVAIHKLTLQYATQAQLSAGRFSGFGLGSVGERSDRFFADGMGDAVSNEGIPVEQQVVIAGRTASSRTFIIGPRSVSELEAAPDRAFNGSQAYSPASRFWVGTTAQMLAPAVSAAPDLEALPQGSVDWLAISHGMFLQQAEDLAAHRRTQSLTAAVVPVEQLYRRYTAGNAHPDAIRSFLREHSGELDLRYLVLFGGGNYNSVGLRGAGVSTLNHVPTQYARTNRFVNFAPTDALYGDLTGDQLLEFSVGRLPVRTVAEAEEAVRKLIAYETQPATGKALLSSGTYDTPNTFSFMQSVEDLGDALPLSWQQSRVHVEALGSNAARTALLDAINQGKSVITYTGHSSPIAWDEASGGPTLFSVGDLSTLPANVNQPILLQFGCWTTYFVSPVVNTLGNTFMLTANRGASSVFGSTVLLDQPNHDRLGGNLAPRMQANSRLGDVIEEARRDLAITEDPLAGTEVRLGITLLGDPASIIR